MSELKMNGTITTISEVQEGTAKSGIIIKGISPISPMLKFTLERLASINRCIITSGSLWLYGQAK